MIPFTNKRGQVVMLDERLNMEDLVRMGIQLNLQPMSAPIPEGTYVHPAKA